MRAHVGRTERAVPLGDDGGLAVGVEVFGLECSSFVLFLLVFLLLFLVLLLLSVFFLFAALGCLRRGVLRGLRSRGRGGRVELPRSGGRIIRSIGRRRLGRSHAHRDQDERDDLGHEHGPPDGLARVKTWNQTADQAASCQVENPKGEKR